MLAPGPGGFPGGSVVLKKKEEKICLLMQQMQVQSPGLEDHWEEKLATHSSILVWRIPLTEEPGRLHPWGLKVGHD